MKKSPIIANLLVLFLLGSLCGLVQASAIAYQKSLTNNQKLVVYKEELPFQLSTKEMDTLKEWLKTQPPGTEVETPNTVFIYNFVLFSGEGKQRKKLWSRRTEGFSNGPVSFRMNVLDISIDSRILIVVFKQINSAHATVVRPILSEGKESWNEMPWRDTNLISDSDALERAIISAKISGSFDLPPNSDPVLRLVFFFV